MVGRWVGGGWVGGGVVPAAARCHITVTQREDEVGGRGEERRETYENRREGEGGGGGQYGKREEVEYSEGV